MLMPLMHVFFVCRSMEESAVSRVQRKSRAQRSMMAETPEVQQGAAAITLPEAKSGRERELSIGDKMALTGKAPALPVSKAIVHAVLAVMAVVVIMVTTCQDRYPFKNDLGPCSPCHCNEAMVMQHCSLSAKMRDPFVVVRGRKVTALATAVFRENTYLRFVDLGNPTCHIIPTLTWA